MQRQEYLNGYEEIPEAELEDEEEKYMDGSDDDVTGMSMIYDEGTIDQKQRQLQQGLLPQSS